MEALRLQTQQLSVRFLQLLGDHLSLIHHVRILQDIVAANDFFRPLFPVPFVSSFEGDDGQGEGPPSEFSGDSNPDSLSGLWFSRPIFHFYFVKLTSLSLTFLILMTLTYFLVFLLS